MRPSVAAIAELLRSRTGLAFPAGRLPALETGVERALERSGYANLDSYAEALRDEQAGGGCLLDDLLVELTVRETYFFRDPPQFDLLRETVLPELFSRREGARPLRIWSAGCATGEEPYSLAILLEEEGRADDARILATDVCRSAISTACEGVYGAWALRASNEEFATRYFDCREGRFRLDRRFRERVTFRHLNLALDGYPSYALDVWGMDVVLCRNVLIYFEEPTIRRVARRLLDSLAEGGWLITGPSDPLLSDHAPFETVVTKSGVCYRRHGPAASPPLPLAPPWDAALPPSPPGELRSAEGERGPARKRDRDRRAAERRPEPPLEGPADCALRIKALANAFGAASAAESAARAATRFPLSAELHFLYAVLLISDRRDDEAVAVLRRVLYLDRSLAVAYFVLASLLERRGDASGARAAYRNARELAAMGPPGEPLPLSDGETAERLIEAAKAQESMLGRSSEASP